MRKAGNIFVYGALLAAFVSATFYAEAQVHDSSYYQVYPNLITGRFYFSHKYTNLQPGTPSGAERFLYNPNTSRNLGIGATYRAITLNLGAGVFNDKERGKTKSLDLQSHIYTRQWVADLFGQFYKGYYLTPKKLVPPVEGNYYIRPDIKVSLLGAAVHRLFNPEKFSYRAAFLQNEWQKKSAGTLLAGAEVYYGVVHSDSALVPSAIVAGYPHGDVVKVRFLEIGPGAGYAYTAVHRRHFFLTGSLTLNADLSFVKEWKENDLATRTTISPNLIVRAVTGYNSDNWSANISWVANRLSASGHYAAYKLRTGNYRITIAKRFQPGKKLQERLKVIDGLPVGN
ncbi:MAG TPA: DUF4421 domain-containing protein [Chitinophagaceae bacterium]|nr:DUF4421 domain-containing protein [Chitinophagaceae bacterium]